MEVLSIIGSVASICAFIWAFLAWMKSRKIENTMALEKIRANQKIAVKLFNGGKKHELPVELCRDDLTRAELLGRLGMLPMKEKGKRFSIAYLNTPEFLHSISNIRIGKAEGDDDFLTIPCDPNEFDQFALS